MDAVEPTTSRAALVDGRDGTEWTLAALGELREQMALGLAALGVAGGFIDELRPSIATYLHEVEARGALRKRQCAGTGARDP